MCARCTLRARSAHSRRSARPPPLSRSPGCGGGGALPKERAPAEPPTPCASRAYDGGGGGGAHFPPRIHRGKAERAIRPKHPAHGLKLSLPASHTSPRTFSGPRRVHGLDVELKEALLGGWSRAHRLGRCGLFELPPMLLRRFLGGRVCELVLGREAPAGVPLAVGPTGAQTYDIDA
jgi:hypothetical protein